MARCVKCGAETELLVRNVPYCLEYDKKMDAGHRGAVRKKTVSLPALVANFASTANSLELLAFLAKDALLVVDDFAPIGIQGDRELHGVAERIFRAAGNQQGRSRMSTSQMSTSSQPPRALVLATGEAVPKGLSVRARLLVIDVHPGDVNCAVLTECQSAALQARFAMSLGAFVKWTAAQHDSLQRRLRARAHELRQSYASVVHRRLPSAISELQASFEIFLEFAADVSAIDINECEALTRRCVAALNELLARQANYHQATDPARQFLGLVQAALASGGAHVSDRQGKPPENAAAWGWQRKSAGRWFARGHKIGWLTCSDLYLDSAASFELVRQMAGSDRQPLTEQTLRHRLRESNLLASIDDARHMLLVRRTLEGRPRQVLHLRASDVLT